MLNFISISQNALHNESTTFSSAIVMNQTGALSHSCLCTFTCAFCFTQSLCEVVKLADNAKDAKNKYTRLKTMLLNNPIISVYFVFLCRTKMTYIFVPSLRTLSP